MSLFDADDYNLCPICAGTGTVWDQALGAERMCDCKAVRLPPPDVNPDAPAGIEDEDDVIRLNKQQARVWAVLKDEHWHTLPELEDRTGFPTQSISARIRDLRKQKYGAHLVRRESLGKGLYRYKLTINPDVTMKV